MLKDKKRVGKKERLNVNVFSLSVSVCLPLAETDNNQSDIWEMGADRQRHASRIRVCFPWVCMCVRFLCSRFGLMLTATVLVLFAGAAESAAAELPLWVTSLINSQSSHTVNRPAGCCHFIGSSAVSQPAHTSQRVYFFLSYIIFFSCYYL